MMQASRLHQKSISEGVTGTCMVLISPDSERTMHTYLGITQELSQDQIDFEPLKTAKWHIEGYLSTSETARKAVKQARNCKSSRRLKLPYLYQILQWFNTLVKA